MDLEKLRAIWVELNQAKRCAAQACQYQTDPALVYGAVGFTLDHLKKAMRMVEDLGRDEKRKRIRRAKRRAAGSAATFDPELVKYVGDRLRKLRPSKKEAAFNSIAAMFQFQGGI